MNDELKRIYNDLLIVSKECLKEGNLTGAKAAIAIIESVDTLADSLGIPLMSRLTIQERRMAKIDKIEAIKAMRFRAGIGLKEAKDAVEAYLASQAT